MRAPGDILLASTYELGHPPHGLALTAAFLERAGFAPSLLDLSVSAFDEAAVRKAKLVAISVPMHTALRLGAELMERVRAESPAARVAFFGLYAPLNAGYLASRGAFAVLGGEHEEQLVELARALERGDEAAARVMTRGGAQAPRVKLDFPVPSRGALPALAKYSRVVDEGGERLAGYVEASRGCKHLCRHCPIPPVYGGRFFVVPVETVLADVGQQIAAGATHVTFGDPDFLNGPTHAVRIVEALHARWPELTYDVTVKVEHLVKHAELQPVLARTGCLFVTSAVESFSDLVLAKLDKGHTRADALRAFDLCAAAGLAIRPTFVAFTPWTTLDDYLDLFEVIERRGLDGSLDPVQLSIRLLVPPGSRLFDLPDLEVGPLDEAALTHAWKHPDPRMDVLQARVAEVVEAAAEAQDPPEATVARCRALALAAAGRAHRHVLAPHRASRRRAPRMTESWFC